ncbi:hypothetical protein UFOVP112_55 [uncultured Caudovirales phage]|uniref:Uncharacterized protein n=1 Tax=uncultured Caudovirales phage TaxID=2100421 RepID=A0A6J5L2U9_9CAUD|nr:hypothetical protein UFOVP112_55 [uncultured Caudovirales phage]
MLDNFRNWYLRNYAEITWFLIGFLVMAGLTDLGAGDYTGAIISFGIAYINYLFLKR